MIQRLPPPHDPHMRKKSHPLSSVVGLAAFIIDDSVKQVKKFCIPSKENVGATHKEQRQCTYIYICKRLTLKKYATTRSIAHITVYNKHKHSNHVQRCNQPATNSHLFWLCILILFFVLFKRRSEALKKLSCVKIDTFWFASCMGYFYNFNFFFFFN